VSPPRDVVAACYRIWIDRTADLINRIGAAP
jgi:hypothetical protein